MADYRKLVVWQLAHELTLEVYKATSPFPHDELFGLRSQLRRAAASVAANIAEGTGRSTQQELRRFCRIALGSLNEAEYHLLLARDLGYIESELHEQIAVRASRLRRMLVRFIQALTTRSRPGGTKAVTGNR